MLLNSHKTMKSAIIPIMGFLQDPYEPNGFTDLHFDLLRNFESKDVIALAPRQYTTDVKKLVAELVRRRVDRISVITFSHGQSVVKPLAAECEKHRIIFSQWVACDPVPRPSWLPRKDIFQPLAVRALVPGQKIAVPKTVKFATGVWQDCSIPHGAELAPNGVTVIEPMQKLAWSHAQMDNSPEFYALVKRHLLAWLLKDLTV
jgi:hypothetical protein